MNPKRALWLTVQVIAVLVVVALLLGQVLGQPILLSYVTTDSMAPALSPGDGFVAVPPALAGSIDPGDVVVYEAEQIEGGGLTTHRVVEETERGYVTQGDANPFTDQDSGEPPVQDAAVVAVAWQPTGSVLALPGLGAAVEWIKSTLQSIQRTVAELLGTDAVLGVQGLGYLVFAITIVLYLLVGVFEDDKQRSRGRDRDDGTNAHLVAIAIAVGVVLAATAAMLVPAGSQEYGIVSAEFDSDNPTTIRQGTSGTLPYGIDNNGFVPTVIVVEPGGEDVAVNQSQTVVPARGTANATVTITTPPETGFYRYYVTEHRYLRVLPASLLLALHDVHPWLPLLAVNLTVGLPFYVLSRLVLGTGRIRTRSRSTRRSGGLLPWP